MDKVQKLISLPEILKLLSRSEAYRKQHGFPEPCFHFHQRKFWKKSDVLNWLKNWPNLNQIDKKLKGKKI